MNGVIITSARYQSALAAVRCLGRHGIKVACGEDRRAQTALFPPAFYSRYCTRRFTYPSYEDNHEEFIGTIIDFARRYSRDYSVLMPVDAETYVVSEYKEAIEAGVPHLKIPVHEYKYIKIANNKAEVIKLAEKIGVPVPKTFVPGLSGEIEEIAGKIAYPAVIKLPTGKGSKGFGIVPDKEGLIRRYREVLERYRPGDASELPLIQEYIPGVGYGVSCLFHKGERRAVFTHRRLRDALYTGGPSVLRVSDTHPEMEGYAVKLLEELKWHGVAMVEFRLDERDNKPRLLEINPRFWGSLCLAVSAGVEFPWLLYQMALNGDIPSTADYRTGVKTRFMWADITAFPGNLRGAKDKTDFLKQFFTFDADTYDDLSWHDPVPAFVQTLNPVARLIATGSMRGE